MEVRTDCLPGMGSSGDPPTASTFSPALRVLLLLLARKGGWVSQEKRLEFFWDPSQFVTRVPWKLLHSTSPSLP